MEKDWVKIFSSASQSEVMIRKLRLDSSGFQTIIINKKDSAYTTFGEIELYVHRERILEAKQLLGS